MRVSAGSAVSYATMPGIFPRLKELLFSGFGPVTQLIAIICFMGGLLPKNHPCFSKEHKDEYGLTRILAYIANTIEFKWKNIDKILVFAMVICGTVMMWLYVAAAIIFVLTSPSLAGSFTDMLITANPKDDIAFMMMDKVFGIPGLFNSSVSMQPGFPSPFHIALQNLFSFYSMAIFFIALVIFIYHMIHIVLDITQTGKVAEHMSDDAGDGSRSFSWLPIRFVMCFGLLLPFGEGLNSAQWITLYAAKYGSGLATNVWINYNVDTGDNPLGDNNVHLIAKPPTQDNSALIKSLFLLNSCRRITLLTQFNPDADQAYPYIVSGSKSKSLFTYYKKDGTVSEAGFMDKPTLANPSTYNATLPTIAAGDVKDHFIQILKFSNYHDIRMVIGTFDPNEPNKYEKYPGKVLPTCGEIVIPVTSLTGEGVFAAEGYFFAVMQMMFEMYRVGAVVTADDPIEDMWLALTREYLIRSASVKNARNFLGMSDADFQNSYGGNIPLMGPITGPVHSSYWNLMMDDYFRYAFRIPAFTAYDFLSDQDEAFSDNTIDPKKLYVHNTPAAFSQVGADNPLMMTVGIKKYGWGGAGLWYNKIGERNGSLYSAVAAVPQVSKFPMVMEAIKAKRKQTDSEVSGGFCEQFNPRKSGTTSTNLTNERDQFSAEQALALFAFCQQLFENQALSQDGVTRATATMNPIEKAIQSFFSEFRIFDNNANKEVTPMAQLTSVGRILIDKAIMGVTASVASYAAGGMAHMTVGGDKQLQAAAGGLGMIGSATMSIALMGLSSGFVLYYMLPIMPFIYFFFAVGRWVKVVFEALVGMPLWALAHMRVGGPGLPGAAAMNGYFLILEIFIRPILTVFGLVAAFSIFSALAVGLNSAFSLVSENLFGATAPAANAFITERAAQLARGMTDQFFLSIFYIYLVYVIGIGSFKLIDLIPDTIMRWSGAGAQSFAPADNSDDMIEQWQFELPVRFNTATKTIGDIVESAVYEPGKKVGDEELKKEAKKKKAQKEAEAQAKINNGEGDS